MCLEFGSEFQNVIIDRDNGMRRKYLFNSLVGFLFFIAITGMAFGEEVKGRDRTLSEMVNTVGKTADSSSRMSGHITIFMVGDVMTGRGIDQVLPHPSDPIIHEPYMKSARGYVKIASEVNGPIQPRVSFSYIWGDALGELDRVAPDVRIINLETSITKSNDYWKNKGIHYRMHPQNIPILTTAKIDICSLANNHVLDWGYLGLLDTVESLKKVGINTAGGGRNSHEAMAPAVITIKGKGRVIVFSFGLTTSGIPLNWAATEYKPGVNLLRDMNNDTIRHIRNYVQKVKHKGDIVVASIHWGSNWGYRVSREQKLFAHQLIDEASVDIIYGHSSHHVKGIEVYKQKLILYGCGDFINDYEGIAGYEEFRADLSLMYFATVDLSTGKLLNLQMTPSQIRRFKAIRASTVDAMWLRDILNREGAKFGTRLKLNDDNRLTLLWD
jgi:poly-gamma-glutamate capsule biosynthesis protein CapA/YwtB (metallophosphatase superfamily)